MAKNFRRQLAKSFSIFMGAAILLGLGLCLVLRMAAASREAAQLAANRERLQQLECLTEETFLSASAISIKKRGVTRIRPTTDKAVAALRDNPELLKGIPAIHLDMSGFRITKAELAPLTEASIIGLDLRETQIDDDISEVLGKFRYLRYLHIAQTSIGDGTFGQLGQLEHLEALYAFDTKVTDEGLLALSGVKTLKLLCLENTAIKGRGLTALVGMKSLEDLSLRGTQVNDGSLSCIEQLPQIEVLQLRDTRITNAVFAHLEGIRRLRWLEVDGTAVNSEALMSFVDKQRRLEILTISQGQMRPEQIEALKKRKIDVSVIAGK